MADLIGQVAHLAMADLIGEVAPLAVARHTLPRRQKRTSFGRIGPVTAPRRTLHEQF
ncbi:hypothetical protein C2845_PM07G32370 [Panicum miliaceum]|uniref:Uncharacterized protein n=1 Tax=Panicum miliaceum TaxID=4540 RepID=A0A3L6SI94_PANMI|nr:hypothetical protein C2845_PM07G32370 [Panicum miliaceum]